MNYQQFLIEAAKHLRAPPSQVEKVIGSAPHRYRHFTIEKRTGGLRDIYHPSPALKSIQRWMIRVPLASLPVHDAVYSYVAGRSVGLNAAAHVDSNYFVRLDFADFFPSITGAVLRRFLRSAVDKGVIDLDELAINAVVRLACRKAEEPRRLALTIGAPSSPHLSNALLYDFDSEISTRAAAIGVVYTRYADDIFISSRGMAGVSDFEQVFKRMAREMLPFLALNEQKTQHFSRKRRVTITGVNVTSDRGISVGREKKREIKSKLYLAIKGRLDPAEFSSLRGSIAYVMGVEPKFLSRLRKKFGAEVVDGFMNFSH